MVNKLFLIFVFCPIIVIFSFFALSVFYVYLYLRCLKDYLFSKINVY